MAFYSQLGYIKFELPHYVSGHAFTKSYGFKETQRVSGKGQLQQTGDALDTRTLDMRFHHYWCNPRAVLDQVVKAAEKKEAMALTFGDGTHLGKWVITGINGTHQHEGTDGTLLWLDINVSLKEFVDEEPLVTAKRQKIAAAPSRKRSGKVLHGVKSGTPSFTLRNTTNKDGFTIGQIVRQQ